MTDKTWMIYGASGYTGLLVSEEALRRGHRPVLAGRSPEKIIPLAERLGLRYVVVNLHDEETVATILASFDLVFHAAGPFSYTSAPMVRACLRSGTNYIDISGELSVFEHTLASDRRAREKEIALISGVGFGVISTDCTAKHVTDRVSQATQLEVAVATTGRPSAGTLKTILEHTPKGVLARRNGLLVRCPVGSGERRIRFSDGERTVLPYTWGDLVTTYHATGIPNIRTYMAVPERLVPLMRRIGPLSQTLLTIGPLRRLIQRWVEKYVHGPDERTRQTAHAFVWAWATNQKGDHAQAWLETVEGYRFTAMAGVRCVERIFAERPQGALTPALAFGPDFVLDIPGTKRYDQLDNS